MCLLHVRCVPAMSTTHPLRELWWDCDSPARRVHDNRISQLCLACVDSIIHDPYYLLACQQGLVTSRITMLILFLRDCLFLFLALLLCRTTTASHNDESNQLRQSLRASQATTAGTAATTTNNKHHPAGRGHRKLFFSFGELACQQDLKQCTRRKSRNGIAHLNLDGWSSFLGSMGTTTTTNNDDDDPAQYKNLNQLRYIVNQAKLVNFTAVFEEMIQQQQQEQEHSQSQSHNQQQQQQALAALEEQASTQLLLLNNNDGTATRTAAKNDAVTQHDEITEQNIRGFLDFYNDLQQSIYENFGPVLGGFLSLLLTIALSPILLPVAIIFAISVWLAFLRRPFRTNPVWQSSVECEAELLSCELEDFLATHVPNMLRDAFVEAGSL